MKKRLALYFWSLMLLPAYAHAMKILSHFNSFNMLSKKYVCKKQGGRNMSPELRFVGVPKKAKSLVLFMHDPDAPHLKGFVHWVMYIHHAKDLAIPVGAHANSNIIFAKNGLGKEGYFGPCPPKKTGIHRYVFSLYALDKQLNTKEVRMMTQNRLLNVAHPHVISEAHLTAVYKYHRAHH